MKKSIFKIGLLALILIIISAIIILIFGRTYTISFTNINNSTCELNTDNDDGIIAILEEKQFDGKCLVKVKAKKDGKVYLYEESTGNVLYVHKSMIITDNNYFGKSTGSEIIPISLTIVLTYILFFIN